MFGSHCDARKYRTMFWEAVLCPDTGKLGECRNESAYLGLTIPRSLIHASVILGAGWGAVITS